MATFGTLNGIATTTATTRIASTSTLPIPSTSSSSTTTLPSTTTPSTSKRISSRTDGYSEQYQDLTEHLLSSYRDTTYSDFDLHVHFPRPTPQTQNQSQENGGGIRTTEAAGGESSNTRESFALHSIIVSQSPVIRNLNYRLQSSFTSPPTSLRPSTTRTIPTLTIDLHSFSLTIASLYDPRVTSHVDRTNCRQVLATTRFLGLERIERWVERNVCKGVVEGLEDGEEIREWVEFVEEERQSMLQRRRGRGRRDGKGKMSNQVNGSSSYSSGYVNASSTTNSDSTTSTTDLATILFDRIVSLSTLFKAFDPQSNEREQEEGQSMLIQVLMKLPFEWFKSVVEDERFMLTSEMDRFHFAKRVISFRNQYHLSLQQEDIQNQSLSASSASTTSPMIPPPPCSTSSTTSPYHHQFPSSSSSSNSPSQSIPASFPTTTISPPPPPSSSSSSSSSSFDEVVVLGFGNDNGEKKGQGKVTILKKLRKPQLWKIGPSAVS